MLSWFLCQFPHTVKKTPTEVNWNALCVMDWQHVYSFSTLFYFILTDQTKTS